ncbi:glycoside hydrolase family 28 protein [Acholeplasma manati]|uniref:Glycoside hydrolase family 28 protein n=1 Tax=Paracholeplasma manati TaxID=591373 RepID=A0ABT2Y6A0_9MOLU|nr:glycoside hydrolase family 28 protein [Paracholeplasma manati]MCV2232261.1 glycoside hydrolase family 28 protein [Paracholeplasma manati]
MFKLIFKSSRSFTFELDNQAIYYSPSAFNVFLNDTLVLQDVKTNVFSIYGLLPNTTYTVQVADTKATFTTDFESLSLNIMDFGAKGDGFADDTMAIQTAILSAPKQARVFIPKGIYLVGPIFLMSDVTIELELGATLLYVTDRSKYPILPARFTKPDGSFYELASWEGVAAPQYASMITGLNVENVKIIGQGVFDGNAQNSDWWVKHKVMRGAWRPNGLFLVHSKNVALQGVTIKNTPSWNLHPYFSEHIDFIDLKIESPKDSPNTDGCDPESCKDVRIIGIDFSVGDDCIALKSGKIELGKTYKQPCERVVIRNCMMKYGHGAVVLGSEMSGGMKDIEVSQCYFLDTDRGLRIKTRRGRGKDAIIDGITFNNIYMKGVLTPLVMNMYYFCDDDGKTEYVWSKEALPVDDRTPFLGKFVFKNMVCEDVHVAAGFFYGLPEQPIKSIELENIQFSYAKNPEAGIPAMMSFEEPRTKQGLYFNYVDDVRINNVSIQGAEGETITLNHVKNKEIIDTTL